MTPAQGMLELVQTGSNLMVTERPTGPLGRVLGGAGGLAFLAGALFFLVADLEGPMLVRLVLCGGLAVLGAGLIFSVLRPSTQRFMEIDGNAREIRYGVTKNSEIKIKRTIPLNTLEQMYMAAETDPDASSVTGLYATGPGTPRRNLLLNGQRHELETIIQFVQKILGRKL